MDALHEAVEVDASLALERHEPKELVHQEALAAPDRAPQIDAAHRATAAQQTVEHASVVGQLACESLESTRNALLRRVQLESVLCGRAPELTWEMRFRSLRLRC